MDPFAKALQSNSKTQSKRSTQSLSPEIESNLNSPTKNTPQPENSFAQAMARAGGTKNGENASAADLEEQKKQLEKEQKKKALRLKLHKEVTGATDIFSTERIRTQKKLEQIRKSIEVEFLGLGKEIVMLNNETRKTTLVAITNQGTEGVGMINYLEKIRQFIRLLRKKVHSARTWLHTQNGKSKKKQARKKGGAGIEVGGAKHEQTKAVFDQMHHEQSTAYSGA
jgi:hypothetical protein